MKLKFDVNDSELLQLMLDSDMGIGHYGISIYEMASVGLPMVAIAHTDEEFNKGRINEYDFCVNLGLGKLLEKDDIALGVNKLITDKAVRQELSKEGMKIVEGEGLYRVTNLILDILENKEAEK